MSPTACSASANNWPQTADPGQDQRRRGQLQRPPGGLSRDRLARMRTAFRRRPGTGWNPYTIQIEPMTSMAEAFHVMARFNTILIDFNRDVWSISHWATSNRRSLLAKSGPRPCRTRSTPSISKTAEGNLGLANALLDHLAHKLPYQPLATRPDRLNGAAQHRCRPGLCHDRLQCLSAWHRQARGQQRTSDSRTWITTGRCWRKRYKLSCAVMASNNLTRNSRP